MSEIMTKEQILEFVQHLAWSEMSQTFLIDNLIWMFQSIEKMIEANSTETRDTLNDVTCFIYAEMTTHGQESRYKYCDNIKERIRTFKYSFTDSENYEKIKREVRGEETVLDLSAHSTKEDECLDLAKHIKAVLDDPKTPKSIADSLIDGLGVIGGQTQAETMNSVEIISRQLCEELYKVD